MSKNKILNILFLIFLCCSAIGCASLQKKFVRKKNLEKKQKKHLTAKSAKVAKKKNRGEQKKAGRPNNISVFLGPYTFFYN